MSLTVTTSRVVRNKNAIEMNSASQLVLILFIMGIMVFLNVYSRRLDYAMGEHCEQSASWILAGLQ
jgi:hypothetical protein